MPGRHLTFLISLEVQEHPAPADSHLWLIGLENSSAWEKVKGPVIALIPNPNNVCVCGLYTSSYFTDGESKASGLQMIT